MYLYIIMNNEEVNVNVQNGGFEESLIQLNKLSYQMLPQLGICSARTHTIGFAQQSQYKNGEVMTWDSQTGAFFVDPKGCYLKFSVSPVSSNPAMGLSFGSGSCANLFSRIVVRSRSGKELTRVEELGLLAKYTQLYSQPQDWLRTIGRSQGYSDITSGTQFGDTVPSTGKIFIINLCVLIPFFNSLGNKMMPPQILEGLRIELSLADPGQAFCASNPVNANTCVSYTIDRPEIHWDCYTLADQFARKIAEVAATKGLNLMHKEYFYSSIGTNNNMISYDIKRAASKALKCHIVTRDQDKLSNNSFDYYESAPYCILTLQAQIGSLYNPNQPLAVTDVTTDKNLESYYFNLYGCDMHNQSFGYAPSVSPEQFTGQEIYAGVRGVFNNAMLTFNLNKSNTSDIVGSVINNSRALLINLTKATGGYMPNNLRVDSWLQHVRAIKVFTSNCTVLD
jgi:hypothetical protein